MIWLLRLAVFAVTIWPLYRSVRFYLSVNGAYYPTKRHQRDIGLRLTIAVAGNVAMFL